MDGDAVIERMLAQARTALADAPREPLAQWRAPRRLLGISRAPRLWPAGTAWHLGVLLLTDEGLLATGEIVRAREEARRGFTAETQRERAAVAAAGFRGGFAEGEAFHVDWEPIDLGLLAVGRDAGPLSMRDGLPVVRWSPRGLPMPLAQYLRERSALLLDPPRGAT